jgi:hypothetical protein
VDPDGLVEGQGVAVGRALLIGDDGRDETEPARGGDEGL